MRTGSPKQTLVQWQLLLTSQGDQMAHLSAKEEKEYVRDGGRKRHEGHKNRELALLSQDMIPPKGLLFHFSKPLWSGRQPGEGSL